MLLLFVASIVSLLVVRFLGCLFVVVVGCFLLLHIAFVVVRVCCPCLCSLWLCVACCVLCVV